MEKLRAGIRFLFSSYKRSAAILFIAALSLSIPITISLVSQQQDVRQRAQEACAQVITPAINTKTGVCIEFSTPCDVPKGWRQVPRCPGKSSPTLSAPLTQCNPREINQCNSGQACLGGICVSLPTGITIPKITPPSLCNPTQSNTCLLNQTCLALGGACVPKIPTSLTRCDPNASNQCEINQSCAGGFCIPKSPTSASLTRCDPNASTCGANETCLDLQGACVSIPPGVTLTPCNENSQCPNNTACTSGFCVSYQPPSIQLPPIPQITCNNNQICAGNACSQLPQDITCSTNQLCYKGACVTLPERVILPRQ